MTKGMNSDDGNSQLEDVYQYVTNNKYRYGLTNNQKRVIRKKAKSFHVSDGEMMFKKKKIES